MSTPPGIAIVNEAAEVPTAAVEAMIDASNAQDAEDFAPAWGCEPCACVLYPSRDAVPPKMAMLVVASEETVPGAEGHHEEDAAGRVVGVVAWGPVRDEGGDFLTGPRALSIVFTHEAREARKNPCVNIFALMPSMLALQAFEMADPDQEGYYVKRGVSVTNFVHPSYFDPTPPEGARFDQLNRLTSSFSRTDTGYQEVLDLATGRMVQLGAARAPWRGSGSVRHAKLCAVAERIVLARGASPLATEIL